MEKTQELTKWVSDVLLTMRDNSNLSPYLDGVKSPFETGEDPYLALQEGDKTSRMLKKAARKNTIFIPGLGGESKASMFYSRINSLIKSDDLKDLLSKEFEKLVDWFSKFSEKCDKNFMELDPIYPLYKMLDPENTSLHPDLHIAGIRILRKIIEIGSKELLGIESDNEEEESEDEEDLDYSEYINFLASKGCVEFLCDYISRCEDHKVLDECILLANALLQGGNQQSQERFLEYMKEDESNSLLLKIKSILIRKFDICKKLIIESESKIKQNVDLSDEEDSEDELYDQIEEDSLTDGELIESNNGEMEEIEEDDIDITNENLESCIINCNRVLRFLQLLCENHNLDLQNFLRVQDHEGLVNNKSFDFVSHISLMFGTFIKEYTNCYSSDLGDQLMATLTELIQGPCKQNQTSLINCKVIDNCTELIFVYNSKKVLRQKGFIGKYEIELDELKQHCVTLLLSLIEGK